MGQLSYLVAINGYTAVDPVHQAMLPHLNSSLQLAAFTCDLALVWLMADSDKRLPSGYVTERGWGEKHKRAVF